MEAIAEKLSFVSVDDYLKSDRDPAASLKRGELWRMVTPIFLHLSMIHLAMNMFVMVSLGRIVERWVGTPRFALFVLLLAVGSNLLQGLSPAWMHGSPAFGGISGVLYGSFGYVWVCCCSILAWESPSRFRSSSSSWGMIVVGLSGSFPIGSLPIFVTWVDY